MNPPDRPFARFAIDVAGLSAAPLVAALTRAASDDPWSTDAIAGILALPSSFGLIAQSAGHPLGFLLAQCAAGESEIINLAVAPEARRQGIGAALLGHAMARARTDGAQAMFLEVAADNEAARSLYEREGFKLVGIRHDYYRKCPNNYTDAFVLRCELITAAEN